ncbi:MAG: hypothetical protein JW913_04660 [Chitinispirillaceae bacterium]|nr:hypothetical protein [Chitinispirillaceae bacterium]
MKFTPALLVLSVLSGGAFAALPAPYLISATALNDTAGQLLWRNNSTAYQGIAILRKLQGDASFAVIDTVEYPGSKFTDAGLAPSTRYFYALYAFSAEEASDTSNVDSLLTPDPPPDCQQPLATSPFRLLSGPCYMKYDTVNSTVAIDYTDSACDETGLVIYRSTDFGEYVPYRTILHDNPFYPYPAPRTWVDSGVEPNRWYGYKLGLFNAQDTIFVETGIAFTLNATALFYSGRKQIDLREKKAEFPVYFTNGWALRSGDSIVVKESNSARPTLLNISGGGMPVFEGYVQTKEFTNAFVMKDYLLEASRDTIRAFRFRSGAFTAVDSIIIPIVQNYTTTLELRVPLNDSVIFVKYSYSIPDAPTMSNRRYGIFSLVFNGAGFSQVDTSLRKFTSSSDISLSVFNNKVFLHSGRSLALTPEKLWMLDYGISLTDPPEYVISQCGNYTESTFRIPRTIDGLIANETLFTNTNTVLLNPADSTAYLIGNSVMTVFTYGTEAAVPPVSAQRPEVKNASAAAAGPKNRMHISATGSRFVIRFRNPGKRASITVSDLQGRRYLEYAAYPGEAVFLDTGRFANKIFVVQVATATETTRAIINNCR